jgi:ABC-2 type transport system ATP-binding protein
VQWIARERNTGVILCSHLLTEVEGVCDDVVILSLGEVVAKGTVTDVIGDTQRSAMQRNSFRVQVPSASVGEAQHVIGALPNVLNVTPAGGGGGWLAVALVTLADGTSREEQRVTNKILGALIRADIPILSFGAEGSRLQDAFLHLTEDALVTD